MEVIVKEIEASRLLIENQDGIFVPVENKNITNFNI